MTRVVERAGTTALLVCLTCLAMSVLAGPAAAHTGEEEGGYTFVVGWGTEPAYAGQQNSVQIEIHHKADGDPVVDLGDTLKVTVAYGDQTIELPLVPAFDLKQSTGTPGEYRAWFFPTAPGDYAFHFTGKVGTTKIDKSFKSSPTTFPAVADPRNAQFPLKAPTNAVISQRLSAEMSRVASDSDVSSARTMGVVGIVVGAVGIAAGVAGIVVAGIALTRKRA